MAGGDFTGCAAGAATGVGDAVATVWFAACVGFGLFWARRVAPWSGSGATFSDFQKADRKAIAEASANATQAAMFWVLVIYKWRLELKNYIDRRIYKNEGLLPILPGLLLM
jgi:hypothetical protein